jgi:hypothetical protein
LRGVGAPVDGSAGPPSGVVLSSVTRRLHPQQRASNVLGSAVCRSVA